MFAPMLLSMGYILLLSEERRNGQIRFHILRSGNWKYCISKVCSGALAGGIVFLIGYALFGLLLVMRFPSVRTFPIEEQEIFLLGSSIGIVIMKKLIGAFLYGMFGRGRPPGEYYESFTGMELVPVSHFDVSNLCGVSSYFLPQCEKGGLGCLKEI